MAVSISDVAQRAGVSQGTVSHVMNGNARAGIAVATQERVRKIAAELGYQPNRMARMLGRRRTDTIGVLVSGLQNPFFVHLLETAERLARDAGYHVLSDAEPSGYRNSDQETKLQGWPMDGALMWAQPHETLEQYLKSASVELPVVYLSGQPRRDDREAVWLDVYTGVRELMTYLVGRGYRRIAYLFPFDWVRQQRDEPRHLAYRQVCEESGVAPQMILMERHEQTRRAGFEAGTRIAAMPPSERPEAVFCFNDVVAQGALFGVRRAGLRVPEDIAIAGCDGLEESEFLDTPLTSVELPADIFCRTAMQVLLRRINKGAGTDPEVVRVPTRLRPGATA